MIDTSSLISTRQAFACVGFFLSGIALGGCATVRQYRADKAELREYREKLIPACGAIVSDYRSAKQEIEFYKVRVGLCDDLNTALFEGNTLLREKAQKCTPKAKKPVEPKVKYMGNPRHLEAS